MKRQAVVSIAAAFLLAGGSLMAAEYGAGQEKTSAQQQQQQKGQMQGLSAMQQQGQQQVSTAKDLQKFSVRTVQGDELGKVEEVVIDLNQGQIGYISLNSQGQKYLIPWQALRVEPAGQVLSLDMSKEQFQQAPKGDAQQAQNQQQAREIHQFFGVSPYWEQSGQRQMMEGHGEKMDQMMDRMEDGQLPPGHPPVPGGMEQIPPGHPPVNQQ